MCLLVGPILKQTDGYVFDSWMPELGAHRSFPYSRIEDAYYARKFAIADAARGGLATPIVCHTSDEFLSRIDGTRPQVAA